jgi:hypothetical protein
MFHCSNDKFQSELGSLDLESLTMALMVNPDYREPDQSQTDPLESCLKRQVYHHELRHFHDIVGTETGFALFMNTIDIIGAFIDIFPDLHELGLLNIPFLKWADDPGAPIPIQTVTDEYKAKAVMLKAANGDVDRQLVPGRHETSITWHTVEVGVSNRRLTANFPFLSNPFIDARTGADYTVRWPLGFRTLTEGNDFNLQAFMAAVESIGPVKLEEDAYWSKVETQMSRCTTFFDLYPYRVSGRICVAAFGKLLADKKGIPRVRGGYLEMALADLAMMLAAPRARTLESFSRTFVAPQPGALFVARQPGALFVARQPGVLFALAVNKAKEILERNTEREFELLEFLDLVCDELSWNRYTSLPSTLLKVWQQEKLKLEEKLGNKPPSLMDQIVQSVLDWHIEVLRERACNPGVMASTELYVRNLHRLPNTPAIWGTDGLRRWDEERWFLWPIFLHAIHILLTGRSKACIKYLPKLRALERAGAEMGVPCREVEGRCAFLEAGFTSGMPCYMGGVLATCGFADLKFRWSGDSKNTT